MAKQAWQIQGVALGTADDLANSLAARVVAIQTAQGIESADILKIDGAATLGLLGVSNSLAYRVHEIEKHFHNRERWFGKLAVQTATDWADNNLSPYRAISGNNAYGTDANDEALVIGTADTPAIPGGGGVKYDVHRLLIVATSVEAIYKMQMIYGSGTMAAALAAEQFSTFMVKIDSPAAASPAIPVEVMMPRVTCGVDKIWARVWCATNNATLDFFVGLHEYQG